jgi:transposase
MTHNLDLPGLPPAPFPAARPASAPLSPAQRRIHTAARQQIELVPRSLDQALPADHPARLVWALVERLDLEAFFVQVRSALDGPGRPASDPQVLLALWIYAIVDAVGSARRLARLCQEHDAYRWLRGGVPVNYHLLSDFRVAHRAALDELLTDTIAVLLHQDLVTLETVAQDGIRVRASAGSSSFRRRATLEQCRDEAQAQVKRLAEQADAPDPTLSKRQRAAQERAVRERMARVDAAMAELPELEAAKERQRKRKGKARDKVNEARVSTTDAEARTMKMGDGGFRPAYNVQEVTDGASRAILAVEVTNAGSDGGLAAPLEAQVRARCGRDPGNYLMDGGLVDLDDITALADRQVTVYAPPKEPKSATSGRTAADPRPSDSPAVAAWRARMATEEGQAIYQHRASLAEWTHAQWRTRHGLQQFRVRGIEKVTSVMLLMAVTHNLLQWVRLGA